MTKPLIAALAVLLTACGADEPPPASPPPAGRAETQTIRNTEAVGYGGDAIADKVDGALDKNDENVKRVEQQAAEPSE
jgi:hypothetical protein